jgi:hypothetical protein
MTLGADGSYTLMNLLVGAMSATPSKESTMTFRVISSAF